MGLVNEKPIVRDSGEVKNYLGLLSEIEEINAAMWTVTLF